MSDDARVVIIGGERHRGELAASNAETGVHTVVGTFRATRATAGDLQGGGRLRAWRWRSATLASPAGCCACPTGEPSR